jgi:hypothetical protein
MSLNFLHPILYGVCDLWNWLTYGQNAVALAWIVNIFTIVVLIRTLRAINKQATAAEDQAGAARKQTEVLEQQRIAAERAAEAAEKQALAAQSATAVADAQRIAAEHGAEAARIQSELTRNDMLNKLRPILVVVRRAHPASGYAEVIYLENHGAGVALDVTVSPRQPNMARSIGIAHNTLGPGKDAFIIGIDLPALKREGLQAIYQSQDGRNFITVVEPFQDDLFSQKTFQINEKGRLYSIAGNTADDLNPRTIRRSLSGDRQIRPMTADYILKCFLAEDVLGLCRSKMWAWAPEPRTSCYKGRNDERLVQAYL